MNNVVPGEQPTGAGLTGRFVRAVERWVAFVGKHWLGALNVIFLVYVGMPFLAPVFMEAGATLPARVIYTVYVPLCHQLPERSYFLYGDATVYDIDELPPEVAEAGPLGRRSFIGDEQYGYKMALCERDLAIYGSMFVMGVIFALRRQSMRQLPLKVYLLFVIPIAVDGLTQLAGLRTSNWWLRTLTGTIFGVGTVLFMYPYLARTISEMRSGPAPRSKQP